MGISGDFGSEVRGVNGECGRRRLTEMRVKTA